MDFPGQADHRWDLVPKAWRSNAFSDLSALVERLRPLAEAGLEKFKTNRGSGGFSSNDPLLALCRKDEELAHQRLRQILLQLAVEADALRQFIQLGEELGYQAGDTKAFPLAETIATFPRAATIFRTKVREEAGLAQHHGVPTRLLDWTRRPEIAAFFAALIPSDEKLSLWALDARSCRAQTKSNTPTVNILQCRRYRHSFLHAQDGLFTWISSAEAFFFREGRWPTIAETLDKDREHQERLAIEEPLRKLTLDSSERGSLLRLLWQEKISQAHLMPTYDYIVESLKLRWSLEQ